MRKGAEAISDTDGINNYTMESHFSKDGYPIEDIYLDETSQSGHRFLVIGGIMFPKQYAQLFDEAVIAARLPQLPLRHVGGEVRQMAWNRFSLGELESYKRVVDTFFSFRSQMTDTAHSIIFHASVVDCSVRGRKYSGGARGQLGFNREIYFHCMSIGRRYHDRVFHVYPDYRSTNMAMHEMGIILSRGLMREDPRPWPFRRVKFKQSHECQAIQVADILIGAIAYRLNRHYDKPDANPEKKELCDYILERGHVLGILRSGRLKKKDWGNFKMWVRRHPKR